MLDSEVVNILMRNKQEKRDFSYSIVVFLLELFHFNVSEETEQLLIQIFRFAIVGVMATIIDFIFLYLFREKCEINLLLANTLAFCISVIYNYFASLTFVFQVDKTSNNKKNFIKFIIFSVIGLGINNLLMELFTNILDIYYLISKIISTIFVMIFNFITRKKFLEKDVRK